MIKRICENYEDLCGCRRERKNLPLAGNENGGQLEWRREEREVFLVFTLIDILSFSRTIRFRGYSF